MSFVFYRPPCVCFSQTYVFMLPHAPCQFLHFSKKCIGFSSCIVNTIIVWYHSFSNRTCCPDQKIEEKLTLCKTSNFDSVLKKDNGFTSSIDFYVGLCRKVRKQQLPENFIWKLSPSLVWFLALKLPTSLWTRIIATCSTFLCMQHLFLFVCLCGTLLYNKSKPCTACIVQQSLSLRTSTAGTGPSYGE